MLRVPAGTFVQGPGQGTAPAGLVELRLREFYSMADILLERLRTMAGPYLLETGGMVQLLATAGGQECQVRAGRALELGFPATRAADGMRLYDGQATATGLDWKLDPHASLPAAAAARAKEPAAAAAPAARKKARFESTHWRQPSFGASYAGVRRGLSEAIAYAPATARRLNGNQPPRQPPRQLRRTGKRAPLVGRVEASFEVSEKGGVSDVFVRNPGQADSVLVDAVRRALRKLYVESSSRGEVSTRSLMKVTVRFTADGRVLVDRLGWDRAASLALYRADTERQAMGKRPLTDAQLQAAPLDVVTGALFKKRQANAKRYSLKNYLSEQLDVVKELTVFRVVAVVAPRSVGWYNCDKPMPPLLTRLTMVNSRASRAINTAQRSATRLALVRLGLETSGSPADISLVLRDRRTVIRADAGEGRIEFEQLAEGTAATLVAIRREQGQLYLGLRDVQVSQHVEPALAFRPVTVAELRAAVARFDL